MESDLAAMEHNVLRGSHFSYEKSNLWNIENGAHSAEILKLF